MIQMASTDLVGESSAMRRVRTVTQALHAGSPRTTRDFRAINCGAIPATMIVRLAELFLEHLNDVAGTAKRFSAGSLDVARRHAWPGNVRDLKHAVECAFILADDTLRVRIGSRLSEVERWLIEATAHRGCLGLQPEDVV